MRPDIMGNKEKKLVANRVKKYMTEIKPREIKPYCRSSLKGIFEINILKKTISTIAEIIAPFSNTNVLMTTKRKIEQSERMRLFKSRSAVIILIGKKNLNPTL